MKKTKRIKYLLPQFSRFTILFVGIIIGIVSQHITQIRAYTFDIIENAQINPDNVYANDFSTLPMSSFLIYRSSYSLAYDAQHKNPIWVYEHLTQENLKGEVERSNLFKEDENIPSHLRATLLDYKGSGYDRGHQAPAADHRLNKTTMTDTFYMTNMCPQCPELNRGYWSKLEKHVRDLTKTNKYVDVITGPLYVPYTDDDGRKYVKYQVIGNNNVAVPTHFFKIINLEDFHGRVLTASYIVPNAPISSYTPFEQFQTTVENIEKLAGFVLKNQTNF